MKFAKDTSLSILSLGWRQVWQYFKVSVSAVSYAAVQIQ